MGYYYDVTERRCPRCGEDCKFDGWAVVHANGYGIGFCFPPPEKETEEEE